MLLGNWNKLDYTSYDDLPGQRVQPLHEIAKITVTKILSKIAQSKNNSFNCTNNNHTLYRACPRTIQRIFTTCHSVQKHPKRLEPRNERTWPKGDNPNNNNTPAQRNLLSAQIQNIRVLHSTTNIIGNGISWRLLLDNHRLRLTVISLCISSAQFSREEYGGGGLTLWWVSLRWTIVALRRAVVAAWGWTLWRRTSWCVVWIGRMLWRIVCLRWRWRRIFFFSHCQTWLFNYFTWLWVWRIRSGVQKWGKAMKSSLQNFWRIENAGWLNSAWKGRKG